MRSLKILCAAVFVVLEVGCGLPNPYFLAAPTVSTLGSIGTAPVFLSPGYNLPGAQTNFLGFEVYYKFLSSTPGIGDTNLGGGGYPGPSILQQNGYVPICLSTDQPPILQRTFPAISIAFPDSQTSFLITLTISSTSASYTSYAPSIPLGRDISYPSSTPPTTSKAFAYDGSGFPNSSQAPNNYQPIDSDAGALVSGGAVIAYVNLYVLAYGYQQGTTIPVYSVPTYLGYVQISPFP